MTVLLCVPSKILIIAGFIFSSSVSLDPAVPDANEWGFQCSTRYFLHNGGYVLLRRITDVLVLPQA